MITVNWGNPEHNILIWKLSDPWTFDEFYKAQKQADMMIDSVEGLVDSVFLTIAEQAIPARAVTHFRQIIAHQHKRHRYIVIVGARSFIMLVLKVVADLVPNFDPHLHYVQTKAEAYTLIDKLRNNRQGSFTELTS